MFGRGVDVCLGNIDLNCWRRSLALFLLSVGRPSLLPSFNGVTSVLSPYLILLKN